MTKIAEPRFIESTAGQIAAELARLGIAPLDNLTTKAKLNNKSVQLLVDYTR